MQLKFTHLQKKKKKTVQHSKHMVASFFLSIDTESINFDHQLRYGGWQNFEFSKREKHSGWSIELFTRS